jgi:hypothetical protein
MKLELRPFLRWSRALILPCVAALAQLITTATINGAITDTSGAAIPGALVTLTSHETGNA